MRSTYSAARHRRGGTVLGLMLDNLPGNSLMTEPARAESVPAARRACHAHRPEGPKPCQLPGRPNIRRLLELQA